MKRLIMLILFAAVSMSFTHKELTWVAIGDSITYMNEHLDEAGNRITSGYMTRVVEKLPYIHYVNQGHNGWKVVDIANHIESLKLQKADIYTVFLGTNDWWHGQPIGTMDDYRNETGNKTIYGAYRTIMNKLKSLNSNATIILITPTQRGDFVYLKNMKNNAWGSYKDKDGQSLEQVVQAVINIGDFEHLQVVDLYHVHALRVEKAAKYKRLKDTVTHQYKNYRYPEYTHIPFNPQTDEYPYPLDAIGVTYDGLHPSNKGYKIIASKLVHIMKKI